MHTSDPFFTSLPEK